MQKYTLPNALTVFTDVSHDARCYRHAAAEACRLLGRLSVGSVLKPVPAADGVFSLRLGTDPATVPLPSSQGVLHDGFRLAVTAHGVAIAAASPKGVLNGVYELAERLGFVFLFPGEKGEWAPARPTPLPVGEALLNPRFPFRGAFSQLDISKDYSSEEWLRFYAKLKFNAVAHKSDSLPVSEELGIRLEVGGHGLSGLLPRDLYEREPELFRMFQPEDFGGKRLSDSNMCITNPKAREIVKANYRKQLTESQGAYAVHAWADDLPAGGWCLCPSCRAFSPSDQAMIGMRLLAEAARESGSGMRVPAIAYHDTMFPGTAVRPAPEDFLLYAPRERCYSHALDDAACPRNAVYLKALKAWMAAFSGIGDAHTFEYYFDQVLFRGMYPFLPGTILRDMRVYQRHGIETHLSLQVAGPAIAPEYNMLVFARAHWDDKLTPNRAIAWLARSISPKHPAPWKQFLTRRADVFAAAMRFCGHETMCCVDYRWLPESDTPFVREMVEVYGRSSHELLAVADALEAQTAGAGGRLAELASREAARARFESAELNVMRCQQEAMIHVGRYFATEDQSDRVEGVRLMKQALEALAAAKQQALAFGLPEDGWYVRNVNGWQTREYQAKLARHSEHRG
ncbi:MAG: DUF4838 domain-containing protein [Kiritimatiellae bacterium]|nr:DUF4838 domain-containing protein [Kiritimatiellia bacterium]